MLPSCNPCINGSNVASVISFHLAGDPSVQARICRRWFTVMLCALEVCNNLKPRWFEGGKRQTNRRQIFRKLATWDEKHCLCSGWYQVATLQHRGVGGCRVFGGVYSIFEEDLKQRWVWQRLFGTRSKRMWVSSVEPTAPGKPASAFSAMWLRASSSVEGETTYR